MSCRRIGYSDTGWFKLSQEKSPCLGTTLVTRSGLLLLLLLHSKTVSPPAVCPACHTTLRNPIVTLGMRNTTAERRGALGPTDSGTGVHRHSSSAAR